MLKWLVLQDLKPKGSIEIEIVKKVSVKLFDFILKFKTTTNYHFSIDSQSSRKKNPYKKEKIIKQFWKKDKINEKVYSVI